MKKVLTLVALFLTACGGGSGSSPTPLTAQQFNGTWTMQGMNINGASIVTSGISEKVTLDNTKTLHDPETTSLETTVYSGSGCTITEANVLFLNGSSFTESPGTVSCSPSPCVLSYTLNGIPVNLNCPSSFPVTNGGTNSVSVNGNTMSVSNNDGKGSTTTINFVKSN